MKRILCLLLLFVFNPTIANALGLGNLDLNSALNEPFEARVELLSATADELDSMKVGLADSDAFARANIERPFLLSKLKFALKRSVDEGPDYIRIFSKEPIREPFLNFLIEVNWGKGRLFREYTVLLDPPLYDPNAKAKRVEPTPSYQPDVALELDSDIETSTPVVDDDHKVVYADDFESYQGETTSVSSPRSPQISYSGGDYGPTKDSDTLWSIASAMRSGSTSVNQMMLALLKANPDAFFNQNINGLKRGQILRMPSEAEINTLTQAEALEQVKAQYAAWGNAQDNFATTVTERAQSNVLADAASSTDTVSAEEDTTELKLVGASSDVSATEQSSGDAQGTQEELILAQESLQALTQENIELKDQLQESEALLNDLKRLLSLKDNELAALQAQMGEQVDTQTTTVEELTEEVAEPIEEVIETVDEVVEEEPVADTEDIVEEVEQAVEETVAEEELEAVVEDEVVEAVEEAVTEEVEADTEAAAEEEVEEVVEDTEEIEVIDVQPESSSDGIMGMLAPYLSMAEPVLAPITGLVGGNPLYALAIVALVILLLLALVVMKFRKKSDASPAADAETVEAFPDFNANELDVEEEIDSEAATVLPESESEAETVAAESDADDADSDEEEEKTQFVSAEPEPVAEEEEELDEDPLQEVNTYLAFEQFDQAEEFVRNAITDNPDNAEFHTKLLEVFYTSGNKKSYEEEAKVLHDLVSGEGEHWDMAVAMWSEMSPNRALFEEGEDDDDDASDTTGGFVDVTADEESADDGLDFDIGAGADAEPEAAGDDEELLDITAADESEDILDVTAAVGLESEEPEADDVEEDVLDISSGGAEEDLLDVTAAETVPEEDGVLDISGGSTDSDELLDLTAGEDAAPEEDLLDVTAAADLELDSDEDLLDVTAATSAGADSDELLDVDMGSNEEPKAEESEDSNVIDFDLALSSDSDDENASDNNEEATEEIGLDIEVPDDSEEPTDEVSLDLDIPETSAETESADSDFELDLGADTDEEPVQLDVQDDDDGLSLDLDIESDDGLSIDADADSDKAEEDDMPDMDFDLSIDESTDDEPDLELDGTVEIPKLEIDSDDDDDDDDEDHTVFVPRAAQPEEQSVEDEIATKLDLAKAYVELGDKDSAKTILDEVMQEGNDDQKKQAQELLNQT